MQHKAESSQSDNLRFTYHHQNIECPRRPPGQAEAEDQQRESHGEAGTRAWQAPHWLGLIIGKCRLAPSWDLLLYNVVQLEMFGSRTCVMTTPYEVNLMQIND